MLACMLMEELFARGIMMMGPSRDDPQRQVGVFNKDVVGRFAAVRLAEMEKVTWLAGDWTAVNKVPLTRTNPAYEDIRSSTLRLCETGAWICRVGADGRERPHITFDPFSKQWMYVLAEGAYGILRSPGWTGNQIVFAGRMTMIGVDCEWRLTWNKATDDQFSFLNEEQLPDGSWGYVDEWEFRRK
jgi:hypothetical protein